METTTGTKVVLWGSIGSELQAVVFDLRWMVILSGVLIVVDLWWGYLESRKRYDYACQIGNETLKDKYKWHKSRAVRRTMNKLIEYLSYLVTGALIGLAITGPMDICSHVWTAAILLGIGSGCDISSIIGHIAYVKFGVEISAADAWRIFVRFLGRLIKVKSQEIGEAVEEIAHESEKNDIEPIENEAL